MLALLATVVLAVAPGGEVNPSCPARSHGYNFAVVVGGRVQRHAHYERGALVFRGVAVVLTFRRSVTVYNTGRRWLDVRWSCEP